MTLRQLALVQIVPPTDTGYKQEHRDTKCPAYFAGLRRPNFDILMPVPRPPLLRAIPGHERPFRTSCLVPMHGYPPHARNNSETRVGYACPRVKSK